MAFFGGGKAVRQNFWAKSTKLPISVCFFPPSKFDSYLVAEEKLREKKTKSNLSKQNELDKNGGKKHTKTLTCVRVCVCVCDQIAHIALVTTAV